MVSSRLPYAHVARLGQRGAVVAPCAGPSWLLVVVVVPEVVPVPEVVLVPEVVVPVVDVPLVEVVPVLVPLVVPDVPDVVSEVVDVVPFVLEVELVSESSSRSCRCSSPSCPGS